MRKRVRGLWTISLVDETRGAELVNIVFKFHKDVASDGTGALACQLVVIDDFGEGEKVVALFHGYARNSAVKLCNFGIRRRMWHGGLDISGELVPNVIVNNFLATN